MILLVLTVPLINYSFAAESIKFSGDGLESISIQKPALYPEKKKKIRGHKKIKNKGSCVFYNEIFATPVR